jgi:GNAT superfamily N-acetyltransferase
VAEHPREGFSCDHPEITAYFRGKALAEHDAYKVRVRVATLEGETRPIGFYSLVIGTLAPQEVRIFTRKFGKKRTVPSVYLAAVAVQSEECRKGIGELLMLDAFEKAAQIADLAGTACMTLDAVDEDKAQWYERRRFERFGIHEDGRVKMFIPLQTIQDALA